MDGLTAPAPAAPAGIKAIRNYLYYNVTYEYGSSGLAPPRTRKRVGQMTITEPRLEDACLYKNATASSTYNHFFNISVRAESAHRGVEEEYGLNHRAARGRSSAALCRQHLANHTIFWPFAAPSAPPKFW